MLPPGRLILRSSRRQAFYRSRWLQHHLNALQILAILIRLGVPRPWALAVARQWGQVSHGWFSVGPDSELPSG
jgi:hypothetical protein